ncbi:MAG TPA: beta-mannosidase [Prolixibacteraceae bacterium]
MKKLLIVLGILLIYTASQVSGQQKNKFIKVENGHFIRDGKPYYYVGANYWYGAILGSKGKEGNQKRLIEELDQMKANGIDNLRVLAGAEGPDGEPRRVSPALQTSAGVYNPDLLEGLDFLLAEMAKRKMVAILFLNNAWEWSGGFSQYLNWGGKGQIPYPETAGHTWSEFMSFSGTFLQCSECKEKFQNHIKFMLGRTNQITGIPYSQDPTIMTWELANEPRAFSNANKVPFLNWVNETAAYIKSLDPNHLVTTGTEGSWGCENDIDLFEKIHSSKDVDYMTIHIWPFNWSWLNARDMAGTIDKAIANTGKYIDQHLVVAQKLNKPVVFEEFGLPRDGFVFTPGSPVTFRDKYYEFSFGRVLESVKAKGFMAGVNFWAFSGIGKPNPVREKNIWQSGDDYLGDPPQEAQGLNSVFSNDPTMKIVKKYNEQIIKAFNK